jgi:hypothetical protein
LLIYGAVIFFFLYRYAVHRQLASVGIALLPIGWIALALWRLQLFSDGSLALIAWAGVLIGAFLLTVVVRTDRNDPARR